MEKDNTPTYNTNRKVYNFKDYFNYLKEEESELKKMNRNKLNEPETKQHIGNRTHKFNKITRKIDDLSPNEIKDKLDDIK